MRPERRKADCMSFIWVSAGRICEVSSGGVTYVSVGDQGAEGLKLTEKLLLTGCSDALTSPD